MARAYQKTITTALLCAMLAGCGSIPVIPPFPVAPPELLEVCGPLNTIETPEVKLSELMKVVGNNYTKYHSCSAVVSAWQEWYTEQKKINEEIK